MQNNERTKHESVPGNISGKRGLTKGVTIERELDYRKRLHFLIEGLVYIFLFAAVIFADISLHMQVKSLSLDTWLLSRKKLEIMGEITQMDIRLTALDSPTRIETIAQSEFGLSVLPNNP